MGENGVCLGDLYFSIRVLCKAMQTSVMHALYLRVFIFKEGKEPRAQVINLMFIFIDSSHLWESVLVRKIRPFKGQSYKHCSVVGRSLRQSSFVANLVI